MSDQIPATHHDLFERPILCALSTINPDGQPHTVPVWCDYDGTNVRVNSPDTARKARNMHKDAKVTVLLVDPNNGGHWIEVMGHVADIKGETDGARDHINGLSKKYLGNPVYPGRGQPETRSLFLIKPDKVHASAQ